MKNVWSIVLISDRDNGLVTHKFTMLEFTNEIIKSNIKMSSNKELIKLFSLKKTIPIYSDNCINITVAGKIIRLYKAANISQCLITFAI